MASVKLLKKYVGFRVVLADGTKTKISKLLKTAFKTESGATVKPEALTLSGSTLKEAPAAKAKSGVSKKEAPVARGKKAAASAKSKTSDYDPDYMGRRELVTALVETEIFSKRTEASGKSIGELRELLAGKKSKKSKRVEEEAPVSSKKSKKSQPVEIEDDEVPTRGKKSKKSKRVEEEAPVRSKKSSGKVSKKTELAEVISFTPAIAKSIERSLLKDIAQYVKDRTGYDLTVMHVGGAHTEECMLLQIGLMCTQVDEDEIAKFKQSLMEDAENASIFDIGELSEEEEGEEEEEEEDDDSLSIDIGELDDDDEEGEEDDELDDGDELEEGEELEEEEFEEGEEEEAVELDADELLATAKEISGRKTKVLSPLIDGWIAQYETLEDTFGDEVTIGTQLVSTKTENVITVIGFSEEKNKVALWDAERETITYASIATVVRLEFAEDVADVTESEEEEEEEEIL